MTASRYQHIIPGALIFALAAIVTYLSFVQEPAESFLFPRVISVFFIGLAAWNLVRAVTGMARVGRGISASTLWNILPSLAVILIYVFVAAKELGFYSSSALAFFLIYSLYDPVPYSSALDWGKRLVVTSAFMAIIYMLFALVLQVQTPRGILL